MTTVAPAKAPAVPTASPTNNDPIQLSHLAHRRVIGYLGLFLPVILVGLAAFRETTGITGGQLLGSVSAYYYTGAVAAFVGTLVALSLFLLTYRGYEQDRADRIAGFVGWLGALGVAFFPTTAPLQVTPLMWWSTTTRNIHYVSAGVLFGVFIVFALWLFPRTNVPDRRLLPTEKRVRNAIYRACGVVMLVCILWIGISAKQDASIFWPEVFAFWAFAISWLVKGRAEAPIVDAAKRVMGK